MKTFGTLLSEILDSTQKKDVDKWEKGDNSFSNSLFDKPEHDSITIPLQHPGVEGHSEEIGKHLEPHGFKIKDYKAGLATDKHGRDTKIGKALGATKAPEELKNKFANDPARSLKDKTDNLRVTITKNPYHVAGMTSKGQCWENHSCMNFVDGGHRDSLKDDLKHGTHVAYLHDKDDTELEHPHARIALKKFTDDSTGHSILGSEVKTYGSDNTAFRHTVDNHLSTHLPMKEHGIYKKNEHVYDDDNNTVKFDKKSIDSIIHDPESNIPRHSLAIGLKQHDLTPEQINHVSDKLRLHSIKAHPSATTEQISKWVNSYVDNPYAKDEKGRPAGNHHVLNNPNLGADHLDKILASDKPEPLEKRIAVRDSKNTQPRHLKHLLDNIGVFGDDMVTTHKAMTKDVMDHHINNILAGKHDNSFHGHLHASKFLTPEHVHALTNKYLESDTPEARKKGNKSDFNMLKISSSKHVSDEDYNRIKDHNTRRGKTDLDFLKHNIVNKNPRITSDDIHSAISQSKTWSGLRGLKDLIEKDVVNHPNFNDSHLNKMNESPSYRKFIANGRK